jgi:YjbE family integral membrane protein
MESIFLSLWAIAAIILIDIVLAGDNAVVIGMAANRLPEHMRKQAILWGTAGAILVRVICVAFISYLLLVPGLRLVGGLALIWIAWRLVGASDEQKQITPANTLRQAIITIVIADAVMGFDNALAIAAAANNNMWYVLFGLLISIPIIVFGSTMVNRIIDRYPGSVYVGSFVLFVVSVQMLIKEPFLNFWFGTAPNWLLILLPWLSALALTSVQYNKNVMKLRKTYWRK